MHWFARPLDRPFEIPHEMLIAEPLRINETTIEHAFNQDLQFAQTEHRNGALPAIPDKAIRLWPQFHEGVTEKPSRNFSVQFPLYDRHGEYLAHAGPDELVG